jgi:hypothetical protein
MISLFGKRGQVQYIIYAIMFFIVAFLLIWLVKKVTP